MGRDLTYAARMRRWAGICGIAVAAVLILGCEGDDSAPADSGAARPASLDHPLGAGTLDTDAVAVRDALVEEIRAAGGVRALVTGGPHETTVDLAPSSDLRLRAARRFAWEEEGTARELLELPGGRVCVNRATGRAIQAWGNSAMGWIEASARPYSCTEPGSSVADLVIQGLAPLDPVTRLAALPDLQSLSDLGTETRGEEVTRHLRLQGSETGTDVLALPTTYDLWLDGDLRLVRAEFSGLAEQSGPYTATFSYGEIEDVVLPAAGDRGPLVYRPGVGAGRRP